MFGGVDVCVNNAGVCHDAPLLTGKVEQWRNMFEVQCYTTILTNNNNDAFKPYLCLI